MASAAAVGGARPGPGHRGPQPYLQVWGLYQWRQVKKPTCLKSAHVQISTVYCTMWIQNLNKPGYSDSLKRVQLQNRFSINQFTNLNFYKAFSCYFELFSFKKPDSSPDFKTCLADQALKSALQRKS